MIASKQTLQRIHSGDRKHINVNFRDGMQSSAYDQHRIIPLSAAYPRTLHVFPANRFTIRMPDRFKSVLLSFSVNDRVFDGGGLLIYLLRASGSQQVIALLVSVCIVCFEHACRAVNQTTRQ